MPKATYTIATDLSLDSRRAAAMAVRLAERTHASLDFFCAVPKAVADQHRVDLQRARTAVDALAKRCADRHVAATATFAVVRDVPAAIVRHATRAGAALLVVAPHGVTGWKRVLLGSVTQRVLRQATGSVLVARPETSKPIDRILVAVDRGPWAAATLRNGVALARALGAEVTVLHVVPSSRLLLPFVPSTGRAPGVGDGLLAAAAREFEAWVASFPRLGARVVARVLEGSPAETIVGEARRLHSGIVVMGADAGSRVRRVELGSVSYAVAATSPVSVLIVRGNVRGERRPPA